MYTIWLCVGCLFSFLFVVHWILAERSSHEQGGAEEVGAVCASFGSDGSGFGLMAAVICRRGSPRGGRHAAAISGEGVVDTVRLVMGRRDLPFHLWKIVDTSLRQSLD